MNSTQLRKDLIRLHNTETQILLKYVDESTGELDPEAFQKLEAVGKSKDEIISSAADSMHSFGDLAKLVDEKIKRLQNLKKTYQTTSDSIKKILSKYIPEGEKIHTPDFMISWRKSSVVITDDFYDIEDIYRSNPELVKVTKELKKTEVKKMAKEGLELPVGVGIIERQNLQIK